MKAKGFTFIELIAAMAMISVIMLAMNYVFSSGVYSYVDGQRKEKAVNANKLVMTLLSAELKNSNKYVVKPGYTIYDTSGVLIYNHTTPTATDYTPIAYIEGNAYSRYTYALKKVGQKKVNNVLKDVFELDKLVFDEQIRKTYKPADIDETDHHVTSVLLTDKEKQIYFTVNALTLAITGVKSENTVVANAIDPGNISTINSEYDTTNAYLDIEPIGQNCYLIAHKLGAISDTDPFYKIKMIEEEVTSFTIDPAKIIKITDNIASIDLIDEGYECKIFIKSIETNHEEEISTSTTILNFRGVS